MEELDKNITLKRTFGLLRMRQAGSHAAISLGNSIDRGNGGRWDCNCF
jgi:hypothetical protein